MATDGIAGTWTAEVIEDIFDQLGDIDGNYIVDITDTGVNLFGGYVLDVDAIASSFIAGPATSATWTPEATDSGAVSLTADSDAVNSTWTAEG